MSWEDDNFELPPLPAADEETYRPLSSEGAASGPPTTAPTDEQDFPALLIDLAPLAAEYPTYECSEVREAVLSTLRQDWTAKLGELMTAGLCWPVPRSIAHERRVVHEEARPEAMLSVFEYPAEVDGVSCAVLWRVVTRPTPWEVVDAFKRAVAEARRPLKWQADLCIELEELAEREEECREARMAATSEVEAIQEERAAMLASMHASREGGLADLDIHSMVAALDQLDDQLQVAAGECQAAVSAGGGACAESDWSLIDVLLELVFECQGEPPGAVVSWTQQMVRIADSASSLSPSPLPAKALSNRARETRASLHSLPPLTLIT
jgi:hypothetical protein